MSTDPILPVAADPPSTPRVSTARLAPPTISATSSTHTLSPATSSGSLNSQAAGGGGGATKKGYTSIKARRRERDRALRENENGNALLLSSTQQLAMVESMAEERVRLACETIVQRVADAFELPSDQVNQFVQAPEVSCLLYEFLKQQHAQWNTHHQIRTSPTPSSTTGTQPLTPRTPSVRTLVTISKSVEEKEQPLQPPSPSPPATSPSAASASPNVLRSHRLSAMRSTTTDLPALIASANAERTENAARISALGSSLEEEALNWPLPQRLIFWRSATSSSSSVTSQELVISTSKHQPQDEEKQQHQQSSPTHGSSALVTVTPSDLLSPQNATLLQLTRDHNLLDHGVHLWTDQLQIYTGSDLSLVGNHICVCFSRVPSSLRDSTEVPSFTTSSSASDGTASSTPSISPEPLFRHVVCTIGPIGSQSPASTAAFSSPFSSHTQLFHSLLGLAQTYLPAIQQQEQSASTDSQSTSTKSLIPLSGSAISAAKALRSTTPATSSVSAAFPTSSEALSTFVHVVRDSLSSLDSLVHLVGPDSTFELSTLNLDEGQLFGLCAQRPRIMHYESVLVRWCYQIQQLLTTSHQARIGSLTASGGPASELKFWKSRLNIFDHLVTQFRKFNVASVVLVLSTYKSRHVTTWLKLQSDSIAMMNESRDNVKYLFTLDGQCACLYDGTPQEISLALPQIMNSIGLLYGLAQFYHTSEHITSLLVKTTNQMIETCSRFLDPSTIWKRDRISVVQDLTAVIDLYKVYTSSYQQTRQRLAQENPLGSQFDFSEESIFGNFETFVQRLTKIKEMLLTLLQFRNLHDASVTKTMEGFQPIIQQLEKLEHEVSECGGYSGDSMPVNTVQNDEVIDFFSSSLIKYNLLDYHSTYFDEDYAKFHQKIAQLDHAITQYLHASFASADKDGHPVPNYTARALQLHASFNQLFNPTAAPSSTVNQDPLLSSLGTRTNILNELRQKYTIIFTQYTEDLQLIKTHYETYKRNPPIEKNMPPITGMINWSRQLLRKIQQPMELMISERVIEYDRPSRSMANTPQPSFQSPNSPPLRSQSPFVRPQSSHHGRRLSNASESSVTSSANYSSQSSSRAFVGGTNVSKAIKIYNALVHALVQYEQVWHKSWLSGVQLSAKLLKSTLFVQKAVEVDLTDSNADLQLAAVSSTTIVSPPTSTIPTAEGKTQAMPSIAINFDPTIFQLVREARFLGQMGLFVPEDMRYSLLSQELKLKNYYHALQAFLQHYSTVICQKISPVYKPILQPRLQRFWEAILPGLTSITWSSTNTTEYLNTVNQELSRLENLLNRANDIVATRIISDGLNFISSAQLITLPSSLTSIEDFHTQSEQQVKTITPIINNRSHAIELSCYELIELICAGYSREERRAVRAAKIHLIEQVHSLQFQSIAQMIESNLRRLKEKFVSHSSAQSEVGLFGASVSNAMLRPPVFAVNIELSGNVIVVTGFDDGPNGNIGFTHKQVQMVPSLDQIQECMNRTAKAVLGVAGGIIIPGQVRLSTEATSSGSSELHPPLETYHYSVGKNRRIIKIVFQLTGTFDSLRKKVANYLTKFVPYQFLWSQDKRAVLEEFLEFNPLLEDFSDQFDQFAELEAEIGQISSTYILESLSFSCVKLKESLLAEIQNWKEVYGEAVKNFARQNLNQLDLQLNSFIEIFSKPIENIRDLYDCTQKVQELQSSELSIDLKFVPIVDSYQLLKKFDLVVTEGDKSALASTQQKWSELKLLLIKTSQHLHSIQAAYKVEFLQMIKTFHINMKEFAQRYKTVGPFLLDLEPRVSIERLDAFQSEYDQSYTHWFFLQQLELMFMGRKYQGRLTRCNFLVKLQKELTIGQQLYGLYKEVTTFFHDICQLPWTQVQEASRLKNSGGSMQVVYSSGSTSSTSVATLASCDLHSIDKEMTTFSHRCSTLPRGIKDWKAYREIKLILFLWSEGMTLLFKLTSSAVQERHWTQIFSCITCDTDVTPVTDISSLRLSHLLTEGFLSHKDDVEELTFQANKEKDIETKFVHLKEVWSEEKFKFDQLCLLGQNMILDSKHSYALATKCSDSQMTLHSLINSRYNSFCKQELRDWLTKLGLIDEILNQWFQVQQLFQYIFTVFSLNDVAKQLPEEARRFGVIKDKWNEAMQVIAAKPTVLDVCTPATTTYVVTDPLPPVTSHLVSVLPWIDHHLEQCQKQLSGYLEAKRQLFPRFYFISDSVLLEILGNGGKHHPKYIQQYLQGLFENIHQVEFQRERKVGEEEEDQDNPSLDDEIVEDDDAATTKSIYHITSMISAENERVRLRHPLPCSGNIESWLLALEGESHGTIQQICLVALQHHDSLAMMEFIKRFPAQLVLLVYQIIWTKMSEEGLRGTKLDAKKKAVTGVNDDPIKSFSAGMMNQLKSMQEILKNFVSLTNNPKLSDLIRQTVETLITVQVHQRDVYERLIKTKVRSLNDFDWLKQTRFYWIWDKAHCRISITDVDFIYGNEYMGSSSRLVITPLTDRCYITLAQALGLGLGGSPVGPAGTGKTETVKDMGRTLGKFVVVMNCSNQMDYLSLGKIFKGVALSGVWIDFDEFNRIKLEVLSVVAQQISCILTAIREYKPITTFTDGSIIKVDTTCGIFITMNPTYAGRQELPENLKTLFRNVSMMVPDRLIIIQVRLAASGFHRSLMLAKKFTLLYELCEGSLSKQQHYDFGLRNILSVLRVLGPMKRTHPEKTEEEIFLQVIKEMNVSKLIDKDEVLFYTFLEDVFPPNNMKPLSQHAKSDVPPKREVTAFDKELLWYCSDHHLIPHPNWLRKIHELNQLLGVRHGIMILGPSSSGKTAALNTLAHVLTQTDAPRIIRRMNPKAITPEQMFGKLDQITQDWTEGIFSELWRQSSLPIVGPTGKASKSWIVLDGPVDTLWIENLNSVLDDSKVLTLANGDRLNMSKELTLIFEVENLTNASPATVSRAGMIYCSSSTLQWQTIFEAWLTTRTKEFIAERASKADVVVSKGATLSPVHRKIQLERDSLGFKRRTLQAHEFTAASTDLCPSDAALLATMIHNLIPAILTWFHDTGIITVMHLADINRVQTVLNYLDGLLALRPVWSAQEQEEEIAAEEIERAQSARTNRSSNTPMKQSPTPSPAYSPRSTPGLSPRPPPTPAQTPRRIGGSSLRQPIVASSPAPSPRVRGVASSNMAATSASPSPSTPITTLRQIRQASLERIILFSVVWGLGGLLQPNDRTRFHEFLRTNLKQRVPYTKTTANGTVISDVPPTRRAAVSSSNPHETVFDFFLDANFRWSHWTSLVTRWSYLTRLERFRQARMQLEMTATGPKDDHTIALKAIRMMEIQEEEDADPDIISRPVLEPDPEQPSLPAGIDFESSEMLQRWLRGDSFSPRNASKLSVPPYPSIFIPTIDSVRAEYNMLLIAKQPRKSLLLVGEMGSAKTVTAQRFIDLFCSGKIGRRDGKSRANRFESTSTSKMVSFSSATTPQLFQTMLESCVVKRAGNVYGPQFSTTNNIETTTSPKLGRTPKASMSSSSSLTNLAQSSGPVPSQLILFIDDLNMPSLNSWGDQVTNELVRQMMEYNEVYSLTHPGQKLVIQDVNIMGAMTLPYGGRNDIPNRLKGRFHIHYLTPPSKESLDVIYTSIVQAYFNSEHNFRSKELIQLSRHLPQLTRVVWMSAQRTLLPTPTKSHYTFNIRDLSRIFEGIVCNANPNIINTETSLINLWMCETQRVLSDKLINQSDVDWLSKELACCMEQVLPSQILAKRQFQSGLFSNPSYDAPRYFISFLHGLDHLDEEQQDHDPFSIAAAPLSMSALAHQQEESQQTSLAAAKNSLLKLVHYEPSPPTLELRELLNRYLDNYNKQPRITPMQLVFFPDAIDHLLRICRVLHTPNRGHAMLVGIGGCGKQSLTRLASFMTEKRLVTPALTNTVPEFLDLLKTLYIDTGIRGTPTTFLLTDTDIKDESIYLEYLNMILTSGEIPGLFSRDEITNLMFELRASLEREAEIRERDMTAFDTQRPSPLDSYLDQPRPTIPSLHINANIETAAPAVDYYKEFLNRVRSNLHLILCFSPLHPKFRSRALQFPGLQRCIIDWYLPWSQDALIAVSEKFMMDVKVPTILPNAPPTAKPLYAALSPQLRNLLAQYMARAHDVTEEFSKEYFQMYKRHVYQTPKTFISYVHSFESLYATKLSELQLQYARLTGGLSKLIQAEQDILALESALSTREQELVSAGQQLESMLGEINRKKALAQQKSEEMTRVRNRMMKIAQEMERLRKEAEDDLEAAYPLMAQAQKALETISQKDINLLKALVKPHNLIERVFDAILILNRRDIRPVELDERFGAAILANSSSPPPPAAGITTSMKDFPRYQTSWADSVKMLRDKHFLKLLVNFPKENLDDETIELLTPYLNQLDFNPTSATQVSSWVAGLTTWVISMKKYWEVYKFVQPKKIHLDAQKEAVELAEAKLAVAEKEMQERQAELARITARYDENVANKSKLEKDMQVTLVKIRSARALLSGLGNEQMRWTVESKNHIGVLKKLLGNALLSQTFLTYGGNFNQEFRLKLMTRWKKELQMIVQRTKDESVPFDQELNLCTFISNENQIGEWTNLQGLPVDRHSVENGVILTRSERFPLLIDPQGQGRNWLIQKWTTILPASSTISPRSSMRLPSRELIVCSASDPKMRHQLEEAVEGGKIFLLSDLGETVPTILNNILDKNYQKRGRVQTVSLQGVDVDYHPDFYLYLATKLPNPHFSPEISAAALIIDFTVTPMSLESQLLEGVIMVEKKELEEQRLGLLKNIQLYRHSRIELEDDLLQRLSSHEGNLLNDIGLIDVLHQTKKTSEEMSTKIADAQAMEKSINAAREEYRPIAIRGSILFFLTADMAKVNHMYQTSLIQFLSMFDEGLAQAEHSNLVMRRVKAIVDSITFSVYKHVVRGLFRGDIHMFQLLLALKVDLQKGVIKPNEFELLLKGPKSPSSSDVTIPNRFLNWLSHDMWLGVVALLELPYFNQTLISSLERHASQWHAWLQSEQPEQIHLPDPAMENHFNAFQRLLFIRCVRPDRTMLAAIKFIQASVGERFVSPPSLQLDEIIRETNPTTPIIFLLSTGADPSQSIQEAAKRSNIELHTISMGQGQEVRARAMINRLKVDGSGWLLLQNSHLSLDFIHELQSILASLQVTEENSRFRLWLTTQPTDSFSIVFLQTAVKLTSESPVGMKHGLARQYGSMNQNLLEAVDRPEWPALLYAICFLHAGVIERRKYGSIGWQHSYEFNSSDLSASIEFAKKYLYSEDTRKPLKWETLRYMICEIMYGGRIIDDHDRLLINALGEAWITKDLAPQSDGTIRGGFGAGYLLPPMTCTKVSDYLAFIDTLPLVDPPELLGLAPNADRIYRAVEASHVCKTIWSIQPKENLLTSVTASTSSTGSSSSPSTRESHLSLRLQAILSAWPPEFDLLKVEQQIAKLELALQRQDQRYSSAAPSPTAVPVIAPPITSHFEFDDRASVSSASSPSPPSTIQATINPFNVCLRQEVDRMQVVLTTVRKHLLDLQLTLSGSIMLTPEMEAILDAIYLDQVPLVWEEITWSNPSGTLTSWLIDMVGITNQLTSWLKSGPPKVFTLSSFFNPRGFLTAVKQVVARVNRQWSLDDMEFVVTVTKFADRDQIKTRPEEGGVYLAGLFLDGASWNSKVERLVDTVGSSTDRCPLPIIHVTARTTMNSNSFGHVTPVYRLSSRTEKNFIMNIPLPTEIRSAHWIRRGVAIVTHGN